MTGTVRHYFAGGNTAKGFYNLFDTNLQHLNRLFILKGGSVSGKSTLIKEIGEKWVHQENDVEWIHNPLDSRSVDGAINRTIGAGVVNGTAPYVVEAKNPSVVEEYVNFGEAYDTNQLRADKEEMMILRKSMDHLYERAFESFAVAHRIHDDWEKIFIEQMDFQKANSLANQWAETLIDQQEENRKGAVYHRFLGAATSDGPVDYIENLTEDVKNRYFIKGRPGSGKSTMLKKIAKKAIERGFDIEIYHCGFDPHSLDMVIVRKLQFAIFDSTAPHEYFPNKENDFVIDMYKELIEPGTDEMYAKQIEACSNEYSKKMKEGTSFLKQAKLRRDQLEQYYTNAMNFSKIEQIKQKIERELEN
ncbi:PRK06851 family protein [Bacillus sp. FJAT-47783]|uniref:PRK06851 family protein n=1 Tax=Bacillus sp. FJAT-47783 TaxID=2922712 RepID=UPI001FAB4C15|nr:PRK06851 family protein [Bacillus sp. FJAT-47783]